MHITKKRDLWLFVTVLASANFILFVAFIGFAGGMPAHIKDGHYYLYDRLRPSRFTEVPAPVYRLAQVYPCVAIPLSILGVFAQMRWKTLQREIGDYDPVTTRTI
jgi:hypothetical protein